MVFSRIPHRCLYTKSLAAHGPSVDVTHVEFGSRLWERQNTKRRGIPTSEITFLGNLWARGGRLLDIYWRYYQLARPARGSGVWFGLCSYPQTPDKSITSFPGSKQSEASPVSA